MGVGTLLSILLLVNMCGSNGRKLKCTGRNVFIFFFVMHAEQVENPKYRYSAQ